VSFARAPDAAPAPRVIDSLARAERVIVCPSNPIVSIGPILDLPGVRDTLSSHPRVIAVTPIVRGRALKGPAAKMLEGTGEDPTASGVARIYSGLCNVFVVDGSDPGEVRRVEELGMRAAALDTIMAGAAASERLAASLLEL
jgi:LPPG:FO 2-phospho-L-lactate transferase